MKICLPLSFKWDLKMFSKNISCRFTVLAGGLVIQGVRQEKKSDILKNTLTHAAWGLTGQYLMAMETKRRNISPEEQEFLMPGANGLSAPE